MQAARIGDLSTGHSCYPPRPAGFGSLDTFINLRSAHRKGDGWKDHCCGEECHGGETVQGSSTVFVNGKPLARVADQIRCDDQSRENIMTGSANVFAGG